MALSKVTNYGVDLYKIKVNSGGAIDFDMGGSGTATIRGNLVVIGDTTTVSSKDLSVGDNVIVVNSGEENAGITLGVAGLLIDRGTLSNIELFYDESLSTFRNGSLQANEGAFALRNDDDSDLIGLYVSSINSLEGNDLNFLAGQDVGVLSVTGTLNYEDQVIAGDDDVIPNRAYVVNKINQLIADNDSGGLNINGDSGGPVALVLSTDTLDVESDDGLITAINKVGTQVTLTVGALDATDVQKGISRFEAAHFLVAAGKVFLKDAGIDNVKLVNDYYTLSTNNGAPSIDVQLGDVINFNKGDGIDVVIANDTVTISNTQKIFNTISVSGQPDVVAELNNDNLTLVNGNNISVTTNNATDSITISSLVDGDSAFKTTDSITTNTSPTVIDSFTLATSRSAKYHIQITQGSTYQVSELVLMHNGTVTFDTEYAILTSNGVLGVLTTAVNGTEAELIVTMNSASPSSIIIKRLLFDV
jgi:hypothetical protein